MKVVWMFLVWCVLLGLVHVATCTEQRHPPPPLHGIKQLAWHMARACVASLACSARYVTHDEWRLKRDIESILASHGLTDGTCETLVLLAESDPVSNLFLELALDLRITCVDTRELADSKAMVYSTGVIAALLVTAIAAFLALFVILGTRTNWLFLSRT